MDSKCKFCGSTLFGESKDINSVEFNCGTWQTGELFEQSKDCLKAQIAQLRQPLKEAVEMAQTVIDQAEMPFRCSCGEFATLPTGHAADCKVTKAQAFLSHPEIKELTGSYPGRT